jgi:hypothetical protein
LDDDEVLEWTLENVEICVPNDYEDESRAPDSVESLQVRVFRRSSPGEQYFEILLDGEAFNQPFREGLLLGLSPPWAS